MRHFKTNLILFALGVSSVLPTLFGNFVFDDGEAIVKNPDVTRVLELPRQKNLSTSIFQLFKNDFWGSSLTHPKSHKSYRPLTTITFRLDYALWGEDPVPFHLFNCFVHGLNCVLVYHFLLKCLSIRLLRKPTIVESETMIWASLFFAVHPVHVEPLGGIVGRADLLASFVFLLGFIKLPDKSFSLFSALYVILVAVTGSLFKENAIVIVILYVTLNMVMRRRSLLSLTKPELKHYGLIIVLTLSFLIWRLWFQGGSPVFQPFDNPPAFAESYFTRIASITYIWALNIFILVSPIWLCYDWSMGCVSLVESVSDYRFLLTVILLAVGIRLGFVALKSRIIMISLIIAATTFLPASNLIFTVGFVLAERNLYLPSIGFCLLMSYAFVKNRRTRKYFIFLLIVFYVRSFHRSLDWMSQKSLFMSGVDVCPGNAKVHYNLGTMYADAGSAERAVIAYKHAVYLKPDYYQALNNLGNILRSNGKMEDAEVALRKAVEIKKDFAAAWMNLGIVLSKKNSTEAIICYRKALKHRKYYPDCEYNLGNLYLDMGNNTRALSAWIRTTNLKPTHSQAWLNIIVLLEQEGKLKEAKEVANRASKFLTKDDTLQFLTGNVLGKLEEYENAKRHFENAIKLCKEAEKPVPAKYWSNLGVLYHRWGRISSAKQCYKEALKIEPNMESAKNNLARLLRNSKLSSSNVLQRKEWIT